MGRDGLEGAIWSGPSPAPPDPEIRADAWAPSQVRLKLVRDHWRRMQGAVAYWSTHDEPDQAARCRRAMAWAEEQLGLR
jgi:hypothetical protein